MNFCFFLVIALYISSTISYLAYLFLPKEYFPTTGFHLVLAGFILQTVVIGYNYFQLGYLPIRDLRETLIIICWSLAGVFLLIQYKYDLKIFGVFASPLAAVIMIIASLTPGVTVEAGNLFKSPLFFLHIVAIFVGEALFTLAFGLGVMYLLLENAVKSKRRGFIFKRIPSLEVLDTMGYICIVAGFTLLTTGLVIGFVYAKSVWGKFWSWDPKEVWSTISWLLYAALLHARLSSGWRGRKSAIMAIIGFFILIFTFIGVNTLFTGHHDSFTKW